MVLRLSYVHNGNSCTGKTSSLYWISLLIVIPVKWEVITVKGRPMIYIKGKKGNRHSSILHVFFSGSVHFYFYFLYKDQCLRYRVYTECRFHKASYDFVRLRVLYTCVMKKNVACTSFPGKYFFMWSIYQYWVFHNLFQSCYVVVQYTFWILVDKILIGTMRSQTDMSFWQIGPGKKKNIFIFDPHLGPLPNIRISRMGTGHNQGPPSPLTTQQCHGGLGSFFPRCEAVFLAQNWRFFHVIIGFKGPLGHVNARGA